MEADEMREVVSKPEDTSGEPGDLPARTVGREEGAEVRRERLGAPLRAEDEAWLMGWQTGVIGGLLFGALAGALVVLGLVNARKE